MGAVDSSQRQATLAGCREGYVFIDRIKLQTLITGGVIIQVYIHFSSLLRAVSPSSSVCIQARMSCFHAGR